MFFVYPSKIFCILRKLVKLKKLRNKLDLTIKWQVKWLDIFLIKYFTMENKPLFKLTVKSLKSLSVATSHEPFYALQHFLFYKSKVPVSKRSPWQLYNVYSRVHIPFYHRCTIKLLKVSTYYYAEIFLVLNCEFYFSLCETMTSHTLSNLHMSKT